MKKILIVLLLFISTISNAQNWETVVYGDTNYYVANATTDINYINYDGYLRDIYATGIVNTTNFTLKFFPFSTRYNSVGILDSMGDTWLGRVNFRLNNGNEMYFNKRGDTITINTFSNLNDTWKLLSDSNGIDYFGTVNLVDTLTIDGTVDSIKKIQIQAYQGALPINNYNNSLQLILSKNHGFNSVFEFYCFPYCDTNSIAPSLSPYPYLPFNHTKVEKNITTINYSETDLLWKYKPGNEWIIDINFGGNFASSVFHVNQYDSIISSTLLSTDSISVIKFYKSYVQTHRQGTSDTSFFNVGFDTSVIHRDTVVKYINGQLYEETLPILCNPNTPQPTSIYNINSLQYLCGNKILVERDEKFAHAISGSGENKYDYISGFGQYNYKYNMIQTSNDLYESNTIYSKLDTCIMGYKPNNYSAVEDIELSKLLITYPNPSSSFIDIISSQQLELKKIKIIDLQNRVLSVIVYTNKNTQIDISKLSSGLYFLQIETNKGIITKKIMKE